MPTTDIPTPIDTAGQTPEGLPAKSGSSRLCECGQPACGRFMHVQVHGLFEWLCSDCLEEANLMETMGAECCNALLAGWVPCLVLIPWSDAPEKDF